MFDVFSQLKDLIKNKNTKIDNNVFSLHYRPTVILLILFAFAISSTKYFGSPIECTVPTKNTGHSTQFINNFCWFNAYIKVPNDFYAPYESGAYPAIDSFTDLKDLQKDPNYRPYFLHAYQWIEFMLFISAVLFFFPRYLWRYCWEKERVKTLTDSFDLISYKQKDDGKNADIVQYFIRNKFAHIEYSVKYVCCEVLNFINVLGQFITLERALGLSVNVIFSDFFTSESNHNWNSKVARVFPNLARCEIIVVESGGAANLSQQCVLPINIFATKIFIFLWFYFLVLTIISGLQLVYRGATILSPAFRTLILKRAGRNISEESIGKVRRLGFGDWFILYLVGKNMDPFSFKNLIREYNHGLTSSRTSGSFVGNRKLLVMNSSSIQMEHMEHIENRSTIM